MNEIKENIKIENLIYVIRGKEVMLDSDLARLYECTNGTKDINKAVKRNIERFPEDFYFQLTKEEYNSLRFQNGTLETERGKYTKYLPYVFTEEGVAMLSSVLKTRVANVISIKIMRAFVIMKKYISNNLLEEKFYKNMVLDHDERIKLLEYNFSKTNSFSNEIFYEGQIYDAYSLLIDIFNTSNKEIIIIDNYISKELLDILSKVNRNIIIYTKNIDKILIKKYNSEYHNITIKTNNSFHDRFIIIDKKVLYHSGASFKDLGKKCFCISKIDNIKVVNNILKIFYLLFILIMC